MTIDNALLILRNAKRLIGGDKCLILSLTDSQMEDVDISGIGIIDDGNSKYVEFTAKLPSYHKHKPDYSSSLAHQIASAESRTTQRD